MLLSNNVKILVRMVATDLETKTFTTDLNVKRKSGRKNREKLQASLIHNCSCTTGEQKRIYTFPSSGTDNYTFS